MVTVGKANKLASDLKRECDEKSRAFWVAKNKVNRGEKQRRRRKQRKSFVGTHGAARSLQYGITDCS